MTLRVNVRQAAPASYLQTLRAAGLDRGIVVAGRRPWACCCRCARPVTGAAGSPGEGGVSVQDAGGPGGRAPAAGRACPGPCPGPLRRCWTPAPRPGGQYRAPAGAGRLPT
jgi:hypothetical protein